MLEPMQPLTPVDLPVHDTTPAQVSAVDAIPDSQIKAKMASGAPDAAAAKAALDAIVAQSLRQDTPEQQAQPQSNPQAVSQPATVDGQPPAEAQPTDKAVEVPQKFQTQDGKVDLAKVEKATVDAEAALEKYRQREADLKRKMNDVHALKQQAQAPVQPQQPQTQGLPQGITTEMVDESIKKNGAGWTIMRLAEIAKEQAVAEARAEIDEIRQRENAKTQEQELREIGKTDPWVFSDEGMARLFELRQQYPHLNAAKNPMQAAYDQHLALEAKKSRQQAGQVQTPTPTPTAAKAPPTPVGGARPVLTAPVANLATLTDSQVEQQAAAHKAQGGLKAELAYRQSVLEARGVRFIR